MQESISATFPADMDVTLYARMPGIGWPEGKQFAFTIVDDTDFSSVANTKPVYDFLADQGLLTTKTVWPLRPEGKATTGGHTLERSDYCEWVLDLQSRGFEIAIHGAADGPSSRGRVIHGLDRFRHIVGSDPSVHTNHVSQAEAIYWGSDRFDPPLRPLYSAYRLARVSRSYGGAIWNSLFFWGDVCHQRIKYVRNLVFHDINTLKMDPLMPFHDSRKPYVRYWFSSSYGATPDAFCRLIAEENQDRLLSEGGACIVYTHLGGGFHPLSSELRRRIRRLSRLPGWFVPASQLLDHLAVQRGECDAAEHLGVLRQMQRNWMTQRIANKFGIHCPRLGGQPAARRKISANA